MRYSGPARGGRSSRFALSSSAACIALTRSGGSSGIAAFGAVAPRSRPALQFLEAAVNACQTCLQFGNPGSLPLSKIDEALLVQRFKIGSLHPYRESRS